MSDEQNKPDQTEDEVEGHSVGKPEHKPLKPLAATDEDDSPDVEGHAMGKPVVKPLHKPV